MAPDTWSGVDAFDPLFLRSLSLEVSAVMADAAPIGLALINPDTGAILSINQAAARLLGLVPGEAIGRRVGHLLAHREDRKRLTLRLKTEGRFDGIEVAMRAASGRPFRARIWLRPVLFQGQSLLVASVLDNGEPTPVKLPRKPTEVHHFELAPVVLSALRLLEPDLAHSSLRIDVDCPAELGIEGRPQVLARVLTQLTRNTLTHAFPRGKGGWLRITARRRSETEVEVRHEDDGFGILPEHLSRVFDPFFTTAHSRGATGIGLTIVRTLVAERMRGHIELESRPGRGTAAILTLPTRLAR